MTLIKLGILFLDCLLILGDHLFERLHFLIDNDLRFWEFSWLLLLKPRLLVFGSEMLIKGCPNRSTRLSLNEFEISFEFFLNLLLRQRDVSLVDWWHALGAEDDAPELFVHVEDVVGAVLSCGSLVVGGVLEVVKLDIRDLTGDEALTEVVLTVVVAMGDQWELVFSAAVQQRD
jgi:hypothetical protein